MNIVIPSALLSVLHVYEYTTLQFRLLTVKDTNQKTTEDLSNTTIFYVMSCVICHV